MRAVWTVLPILFVLCASASAAESESAHARAELAVPAAVVPGEVFEAAVRVTPEEGWHVYAEDPGDAGLATEVEWSAERASAEGSLEWPPAKRFADGDIVTYGYDAPVSLVQKFRAAPDASGAVVVSAEVSWLACREACVPGKASLRSEIPVVQSKGETS